MRGILVFLFLWVYIVQSYAQTGEGAIASPQNSIETDRPDQTEASSVVPSGTLQLETGFLRQVTKLHGEQVIAQLYPTTLVRWGVLEKMELRLILEYQKIQHKGTDNSVSQGFNAVAVGTKINITREGKLLPQIAFIGHLTLPSGSPDFKPTYVAPDFRFSFSHTLSDIISLGYNLGYEWDGDSPEGNAIYTLALGADVGKKWGVYAELFGEKPEKGRWAHSADGGFTFSPRYNIQLDASAGIGLNNLAPDYYVSTGVSFRIPR